MKSRSSKERERQSAVQYKFYLQLCLALLCMYIVFLAGINRTKHYIGCVVVSVLLHYFTLASVLWMSAICSFLFWIMVVNPFAKARFNCCRMAIITIICWGECSCSSYHISSKNRHKIIMLELWPIVQIFDIQAAPMAAYTCDDLCQKLEIIFHNSVKGPEFLEEIRYLKYQTIAYYIILVKGTIVIRKCLWNWSSNMLTVLFFIQLFLWYQSSSLWLLIEILLSLTHIISRERYSCELVVFTCDISAIIMESS